jgi:autotransporter-associated beta strand protein
MTFFYRLLMTVDSLGRLGGFFYLLYLQVVSTITAVLSQLSFTVFIFIFYFGEDFIMCKPAVENCIHLLLHSNQVLPGGTRLKIPNRFWKSSCRRPGMLCLMAAILLLNTSFTQSADNYWNVTSGNWSDNNPSPWSLGTEPTSSDNAFIQNGGTENITQNDEQCHNLYLGAANTGTMEMSGGSLSVNASNIGYTGTGLFTQTGGINHSSFLYLANNSGSDGTYNLSGTGQLFAFSEMIGFSGTGTFVQNGGTNTLLGFSGPQISIALGYNSGASGTYILSDSGNLSSSSAEHIGCLGTGTFIQTGGTNSINNSYLILSDYSGSIGTYKLSDTGQLSATAEFIGDYGTGIFTQTGGMNIISEDLILGRSAMDASGTYNLTGGTLSISSNLYIGYFPRSTGTFYLRDTGNLTALSEYVGNSYHSGMETFTQTGGTNTTNYLKTYKNATYALVSGTLNIKGGIDNQGVWDLTNSSAVINATSSFVDITSAILTNAGNVSLNLDSHSLLIVPSGFDPAHYFVSYNNTGILHQVGSPLDISSDYSIYGVGSINDHVNCQGTLTATSTISINLQGGLTISGQGKVNLATGNLNVNDTISGMDGGSLSTGNQYIGDTGTGTFTQTGGKNSIYTLNGSSLYLGNKSGSNGMYNLSDTGELSYPYCEYIGYYGAGTFNQTGGTNNVSWYLVIANFSGSNGTYNLTAGTLITDSISKGSGTAAFNFGGGTLRARHAFSCSLPMTLTGDGGNANIDTAGNMVTLSSVLSGPGGLNKLGSGTLILNASNTYYGETDINAGTLAVNGSLNSGGLVVVNNSGILCGTGTVGNVTVNSGGHIAPGNLAGILTLAGDLMLNSGALLDFDLANTAASDKISMTGSTLYLNAQQFSDFVFTPLGGFGAGTYVLIDAGGIQGSLGDDLSGNIGGLSASLSTSGNDLMLNVVPEPSIWLLLATAGLALFANVRRQ